MRKCVECFYLYISVVEYIFYRSFLEGYVGIWVKRFVLGKSVRGCGVKSWGEKGFFVYFFRNFDFFFVICIFFFFLKLVLKL